MINKRHKLTGVLGAVLLMLFSSACSFWNSIQDPDSQIKITALNLGKTSLKMKRGSLEYIPVSVKPSDVQKDVKLEWSYDKNILECDTSSAWGITVKAVKEGQTTLRCSFNGYDASCLVTVEGIAEDEEIITEPYIYSNWSILQTSPGISEKVFVSLYGGDASDLDGYSWSVDNPSVASIQETGQYCVITAKNTGYARIKVTHKKAAYPYYIGIYVFDDETKLGYLTTSNNIVTMNEKDGEKSLSVSLVNGKDNTSSSQGFSWELLKEDGSDIPVSLAANGNNAVLTPLKGGFCTVRVTHPESVYPLDILCRVITIVENVYINPDKTVITLSGENEETVTVNLEGLKDGEYDISSYSYSLTEEKACDIIASIGNQVTLRGKANGSEKLIISHPKAAYKREVLVIVNGQLSDAVDASVYITTSQNFIRTKVGEKETEVNIYLKGGDEGDEKNFTWAVKSTAKDGSTSDVIRLTTTTGSVMLSRAAAQTYSYGSAWIEPLKEGSAVITVTHPKAVYPTEILVKVLDKDAVLEEPLYFTGSGLVKLLNGTEAEYRAELKGENKSKSDDEDISFTVDNPKVSLSTAGSLAVIKAPSLGNGETKAFMTIKHPKADTDKSVLIMSADSQESLDAMKALYSDKLYYNINKGESEICRVYAAGFDENGDYDFAGVTWRVKDPSVLQIEKQDNNPFACRFTGLKSGETELTVSFEGVSCPFKITVYPEGSQVLTPECYLTTGQNVIVLKKPGLSQNAYIGAVNIKESSYSQISWVSENPSIAQVQGNGVNGTITSVSEGETVITVSHPESENVLKIYVRVGSEYVMTEAEPLVYISTEDVVTLLRDDSPRKLQAVLVNYDGQDTSGFVFETDNPKVASITAQSLNGNCFIKPEGSGQCQITVSHPSSSITKQVLIVVGNSSEELAGFTYLTTPNNVVAIGEGNTKQVSVSVKNAENPVIDGYVWSSGNPAIVDVTSTGATAVLKANSIGTAFVTVTNQACKYSLSIIVQVVDPIAASKNPYIQLSSSVINVPVGNTYTTLSADLVGGTDEDKSGFTWSTNDSSVCLVYGQNEVGKLKGVTGGQTYVTVTHPKAAYSAQVLVICDEESKKDCYISVPTSILTIKPNAPSQTITASLVNGTTTDKYNFSWSLDVYDIIDFQYSANVCTITPKQSGSVTITVSHPKAAYSQQIIVNVQEYSSFAFPQDSISLTQGTVNFQNMQVPVTNVSTYTEYTSDNPAICSITGTKAVAQITGVSAGTTTVRAVLKASSTGVEQARSEMLVYVKKAQDNAVYITSGSTIFTVNKGKSQSLSATLTGSGISTSDQYDLKWSTQDTDKIKITGIGQDGSVKGQSIYVTALSQGEALITCSHEKAQSDLQFYVVVPGTAGKNVMLNKTYVTMTKGSSGSQLKATIENAESTSDYNTLEWSADRVNGNEIVRIMGNGQTVTLYPVAVGETTVQVQLPENGKTAKCTVVVEADKSLTFETSSKKVQPFHTKRIKYEVSPPDAILTWTTSQEDDFFEYKDLGKNGEGVGYVEISGLKLGEGTLACVTNGSAKASCAIRVLWEYQFDVDTKSISGTPAKTYTVNYSVNPADADISISDTDLASLVITRGMGMIDGKQQYTGKGTITVTPKAEGSGTVSIRATNKDTGETIGSSSLAMNFIYPSVNIRASLAGREGNFSHYDSANNTLYIGDGEKVTLSFSVDENISWSLASSSLDHRVSSSQNSKLTNGIATQVVINNASDVITQEYLIPTWYVPMGVREVSHTIQTPNGPSTTVTYEEVDKQLDPKTDFRWVENDVGFLDFNAGWNLSPSQYWKKEIPSKANTRMSIAEYQSTPWYWQPAHGAIHHWTGSVAAGPWDSQPTGNQPAKLVNSNSTAIVSSVNTDILTVNITHCGKTQKFQINVVTETRNCSRYQ